MEANEESLIAWKLLHRANEVGINQVLSEMDKNLIEKTLRLAGGNRTLAAKALKIGRTTLTMRMKKYGLPLNPPYRAKIEPEIPHET